MAIKKELTDRQEVFLDCLFDEANGNLREAMRIAGYSANTKTSSVLRTLQDQIIDRTQMYLAANGPMAAMAMTGVLTDPTALGNRDRIAASREILDRTGIVKTERITVKTDAPSLLIFPPKSEPTYDDDEDDEKSIQKHFPFRIKILPNQRQRNPERVLKHLPLEDFTPKFELKY